MKSLFELTSSLTPSLPTVQGTKITERGDLMQFFLEKLNPARKADGFRPLTMSRMGTILQGIPTMDLYTLKSKCVQSKNFSSTFWYELKPRNI